MANGRRKSTPLMMEAVPVQSGARRSGGGRALSLLLRVAGWLLSLGLIAAVVGVCGLAAVFLYYGSDPAMPRIERVGDYHPKVVTRVVDKDGNLLGEIFEERRTLVPRSAIPPVMVHAIVDAEDAQFFEHKGLNYWGMLRALVYNLRPGAHLQGASTITQQLVKTYLLKTNERTVKRKVQEAILARRLESALTKDEILYIYLNQIYFGHRRYGIEEAARFYFGKGVSEVSAGEAALLASLPKGPEEISPLRHPDRAKDRQRYVLSQMLRYGHVDRTEAERFASAPIAVVKAADTVGLAPEFVDEARRHLVAKFGDARLPYLGLTVVTTCDARVQRLAREALEKNLESLDERQGYRRPVAHLKVMTPQAIKGVLVERSLRHLHQLLGESPTKAQRARWLDDRDRALATGKLTEAVVIEVRTALADYGLLVDTGTEQGFLRVQKPGDKHHDRYNPKDLPIEKRFAVGDVITVRAEPSLGRHPAPSTAPATKDRTASARTAGDAKQEARGKSAPPASASAKGRAPLRTSASPDDEAGEDDDGEDEDASGWPMVVAEFGPQGAVMVIDPATRDVRAMVGGYGFRAGGFNRATQAKRQPGSAFKPFVYAAAFVSGKYTPASVLNDAPEVYDLPGGRVYKPKNAESHEFLGPIRLRVALARSKNTVALHLTYDLGPGPIAALARQAGIESPLEETLALGLGASGVSLEELTNAYATFDTGGKRAAPRLVSRIGTDTADTIDPAPPQQALSPEVAFLLTSMMQSVISEGTAAAARGKLHDRPAAGKTGTTNSERDAWFIGYTPDLVVGTWVGFDDMRDLGHGEQGARGALPIWVEVINGALKGVPPSPFRQPPAIEVRRIDAATGKLAAPGAQGGIDEVFLPGTAPTEIAPQPGEDNPDTFLTDQPQP